MPSHPRVEEVSESDSDVDMSDPSEGDIDDFADADILRRVADTKKPGAAAAPPRQAPAPQQQRQQQQPLPPNYPQMQTTNDDSAYRAYQCLYPVYFDATRTRAEGRRVASSFAVRNPLATEIVAACASLRLPAVFEAGKLHPKDWANPGRVRVNLKESHVTGRVKNKHHLYLLVAKHLREHPVTEDGPALRMVVRGAPPPPQVEAGKPWPRPAVPRGWKMGELLPYYSPAMTGGGVSENFLKDMMKEMQGGGDMASMLAAAAGGGGPSGSGSGGGKKDKKGKGK
ncbi:signal recognition particle SEC65 subunit [Podospora aff. communis PSN243]|uniref:Signal recognition particle SEC65 subunit n=1 Tax=Podospora aff. communis PSN243 TaxID=3040156 RepID=A0AAV9GXL2_9PEZI|nr:signal recognition particle SEC65 subunit [Podospora aff. communis PSN243]